PVNDPIDQVDMTSGYRPHLMIPRIPNNDKQTMFVLSFSGGGTRAAALAYGVLKELRSVEFAVGGQPRRLIDEVDAMTGVSGGSFTALSYSLYGDALFDEYEERFLRRNVQGKLLRMTLNPFNWPKLMSGKYGRSDMAAEYYDEILFQDKTFNDLIDNGHPIAMATGTDVSFGARLAYFQNDFDMICSDVGTVKLSRAAATSSAVPMVLSPITLTNYSGRCNYQYPPWVRDIQELEPHERPAGRSLERYHAMREFRDSTNRPWIHLVDGGVADNIGVRGVLEAIEQLSLSAEFSDETGFSAIRRVVVIVVNAHAEHPNTWETKESPPGTLKQLGASVGVPMERYSFETIELMKDRAEVTDLQRRLRVAEARLAGASEEEANAMFPRVTMHMIAVGFEALADPERRKFFGNLPTSFVLSDDEVTALIDVGGELLRQSLDFRAMVKDVTGQDLP
ncbi:MAG: patatin-like phospholipase family protein, partial [Xanthomonadales bacterium]|nr:patatin-like phospholipase family protein [Xanthomonadales bacterium]